MPLEGDYAPQTPEDGYHPRFGEALQKLPLVEYLLDVLLFGDIQSEKAACDYGLRKGCDTA